MGYFTIGNDRIIVCPQNNAIRIQTDDNRIIRTPLLRKTSNYRYANQVTVVGVSQILSPFTKDQLTSVTVLKSDSKNRQSARL